MIDLTKYNPVLLFSAGYDSTLILAMLIDLGVSFDIVQFGREFWTKEQKKRADDLISKWNLKVYSYPPATVSFIGKDDEIALVREYALTNSTMSLVSDVIEGDRCIVDLKGKRVIAPPYHWDMVITGSRVEDKHYAFEGDVVPSEQWVVNGTTFYAPLYDKSTQWVKTELQRRGLDVTEASEREDSGNISLCSKCLRPNETGYVECPKENNSLIPLVQWQPEQNLAAFRAAYAV